MGPESIRSQGRSFFARMRSMRPHIGAAGLLVLLSGCNALDHFEHEVSDQATIPGRTTTMNVPFALNYAGGGFTGLNLSSSDSFTNNGVSANDVDAIFVKAARIEGTQPQKDNLGALFNSINIWVEAPGVARQLIAS